MNAFTIVQPSSYEQASAVIAGGRYRLPVIKAGGMDVLDHLKEGLLEPDAMDIDVNALHQGYLRQLVARGGRLVTRTEVRAL